MKAKRIMAAVAALTMCAAMPMANVLPMMKSNVITASAAGNGTFEGGKWELDDERNLTITSTGGKDIIFSSLKNSGLPMMMYSGMTYNNVYFDDEFTTIKYIGFEGGNAFPTEGTIDASNVCAVEQDGLGYHYILKTLKLNNVTSLGIFALECLGRDCGGTDVYIDTPAADIDINAMAFYSANIRLHVPKTNIAGWQEKFGWNETTLTGNAYYGTVQLIAENGGTNDNFFSEFTIKHDITEKEGFTTPDLTKEKFTYTITKIGDAPAIATDGEFTYDATSKEFTSKVALPADSFKNIGDYWYEIKETTTGIAGYKAEPDTYYLHVVTANIGEESGGIGVRQVQLHKTYQKNIEGLMKTKLTFALPEGYKNGYSDKGESSFDWGEGESPDERETQIAYYYAGENDMDFDVYAWKKESGETVESAAKAETKADVTTDEINGFEVAYYNAVEEFDGEEYSTTTYLIDDGEGNIVEFVFWLDEDDENANAKMQEILDTLALRPSDKTDTMTGTYSLGTLSVTVNSTGTAVKGDEKFNVIAEFSLPSGVAPVDITYKINDGDTLTISASEWTTDGKVKKTIANVAGGSTIKFTNLPEGITYKISEAETTGYFQNPKYTFAEADTDENGKILDVTYYSNVFSECYAEGTITDDADALTITNTANVPIDVGTFLESKPFMAIFGGASVLAACAFITRKKRTEDAE